MKATKLLDRRLGYSLAALGTMFGFVAPAIVPAFASAATLTSRSITMSNSGAGQSGVTYKVGFTPSAQFTDVVIDFCQESPISGQTCTLPTGFAGASLTASYDSHGPTSATATLSGTAIKVVGGGLSADSNAQTLTISGITNPSSAGAFYARIYTYAAANNYTNATTLGTTKDIGSVALSATNTIGVSATVMETLTFCVAKVAITADCANAAANVPNLTLGHGSPLALDATAVDTDSAYAQVTTNASSGVTVRMSNNNSCGGLHRAGASAGVCEIPAAGSGANTAGGFSIPTAGAGGFGLSVGTPAAVGSGFGTITAQAPYDGGAGKYGMYTTGVSGTYGDPIFQSTAPVAEMNVPLTFGAAAATTTPAGSYSADMNLVATGTY